MINGSFDAVEGTLPKGWSKFGGVLTAASESGRGGVARFESTTASTKWVYQAVPIDGGTWYAGSAWMRFATGAGEAFIRLSWYASSDGSGRALSTDEGSQSTSGSWMQVAVGPVQAPPSANSVRFRLMLRPSGNATVMLDEASMFVSQEPTAAETPAPEVASTGTITPETTSTPKAAGVATPAARKPQVEAQRPLTLRLSEVLPNPVETGNDSVYEWVEVVNVGPEPVDTSGWSINDDNASDTLPGAIVPPGGYLVIAGASATIPEGVPVVRVEDGRIGNGLNNLGETLTLRAPDGSAVDQMSYSEATETPAPGPGETVGVASSPGEGRLGNAWMVTSRATPGFPNEFPKEPTNSPVVVATESASESAPDSGASSTDPSSGDGPEAGPTVTEPGKRSTIPWFILIAAVGAGIGGLVVRRGPALVRLKDRITRRA